MRIAFCWTDLSGYFCSCLKALQSLASGCVVKVVAWEMASQVDTEFSREITDGLDVEFVPRERQRRGGQVAEILDGFRPDVVVFAGWSQLDYVGLMWDRRLSGARFVMTMDNQCHGGMRQLLGKVLLPRLLQRLSAVVVPGERTWQFARWLGFPEQMIFRGLYGVDFKRFHEAVEMRKEAALGARRFLFVGRYVPGKGIEDLLKAYRVYSADAGATGWGLDFCGIGPLRQLLTSFPVEDLGFIQPKRLVRVFGEHQALILPSHHENWGQVIVEASAAGMPVICTEACGASVEVVRSGFNGVVIPTGDVRRLATAMAWIHAHESELAVMGSRGALLAEAYSSENWAHRWETMVETVTA